MRGTGWLDSQASGSAPSPRTREGARNLALGTSLPCALPTQHSPRPVLGGRATSRPWETPMSLLWT